MDKPTASDFKTFFVRDFPYGADITKHVLDADIDRALAEADASFNEALWSTQDKYTLAYLLLTAHNLVMDLRASSQGISGQFSWLQASKSVGSVSESFSIPQKVLDHPVFAVLSKTTYGAKYLAMLLPLITGPVFTVPGATQA